MYTYIYILVTRILQYCVAYLFAQEHFNTGRHRVQLMYMFSKVSAIVIEFSESSSKLSFEKFYLTNGCDTIP